MPPPRALTPKEVQTHVVGAVAKVVSERMSETHGDRFQRFQAAVYMIMGFLPRDAIESMLAGHCVMFHELMLDGMADLFFAKDSAPRRIRRANIAALDKCFGANLIRLEHWQERVLPTPEDADATDEYESDADADTPEETGAPDSVAAEHPVATDTPPAEFSAEPAEQQPAACDPTETQPAGRPTGGNRRRANGWPARSFAPTPALVEACLANPEVMAAIDAGDAAAFARAMGVENPGEAFLTAAAQPGSPFYRGDGS